ncbi:hypothetical protein SMAC4_08015 [Sordaria macrospora]|uniref:WGS project CABT00000000 data, contig 2.13 n=1 Tax=Sordaria macrospora (strain ATCC MYA-333 / DSM 997 / K(L3346) / K-hell) TaxID=771870 RepID=F7VY68_SORMK|nr:uncharacterized protein SMAC_08015 [Sordaria macrospora k-hell]KAH7631585.1 hypothetical protein B0T09DRAFT_261653 [Sordaria sp. MPI-SDFR-AT-0083]WPJ62904.1 hypothetical protein SMAC4_08015 [Sordaria macrospora]CCC10462.1 unnamed protein product [Sordaria macrospora k-hell]
MGQGPSALQTCINGIADGRGGFAAYPNQPLYQLSWVKPYNLDIKVVPEAVVRPKDTNDVAEVIKCATKNGYKVQAKSGGHSFGNYGLGGGQDGVITIDLKNFQQFSMDNKTWQATIGAGSRLGDVTDRLHDAGGRAMAHGVCPDVGIGGHATIGGLGPMSRMWGSALDHVVEVEVVTADGKIQRASETQNSDLFWGLRGAASSLGVITKFVVRTHPEPANVVQYTYNFIFGKSADVASTYSAWQDLISDPKLDRRFGSEFILNPTGAIITGTFYGTESEYRATGIPDRLPGKKEWVGNNDWLTAFAHDAQNEALYLSGLATPFYSKSLAFRREELINTTGIANIFKWTDSQAKGTPLWFIIFDATGGAIADVPMNATAYSHRDKVLFYQSYGIGIPLSGKTKTFLENFHNQLTKWTGAFGTYAGYVDPKLKNAQDQYWGENYEELRRVKKRWDPKEVFWNPQSVKPAQ